MLLSDVKLLEPGRRDEALKLPFKIVSKVDTCVIAILGTYDLYANGQTIMCKSYWRHCGWQVNIT